ncbi:hypothetical protein ACFL6D_01495 [Spirochaetota bacterium]
MNRLTFCGFKCFFLFIAFTCTLLFTEITIKGKSIIVKDQQKSQNISADDVVLGAVLNDEKNRIAYYTHAKNEKYSLYISDLKGKIYNKLTIPKYDDVIKIYDLTWYDFHHLGYLVYVRPDLSILERVSVYDKDNVEVYNGVNYSWSENYKYVAYKVWLPSLAPEEYQNDFLKVNEELIYPPNLDFTIKHNHLSDYFWHKDFLLFFLEETQGKKQLVVYSTMKNKLQFSKLDPDSEGIEYDGKETVTILSKKNKAISTISISSFFQ